MIKNNILASIKHSTTPPTPITVGIYHDTINGLISISSDGTNWLTISDKNLGASVVYNNGDTLDETNCGGFFQRGNNYMFPFTGAVTKDTTKVDARGYGPGNYYSSNVFINLPDTSSPVGWSDYPNDNLWGNVTDTVEARQGPCQNGFHVPTYAEIDSLFNIVTGTFGLGGTLDTFGQYLKMPAYGARNGISSNVDGQSGSRRSYYWTSTPVDDFYGYYMYFNNYNSRVNKASWNAGFSIRPFKNVPVTPDTSRTVLYQPSNDVR